MAAGSEMIEDKRLHGGRAAQQTATAANPHIIEVVIYPADPNAPPALRMPSSRTIARLRKKAKTEARNAAAAQAVARQVQPGLRPPVGPLYRGGCRRPPVAPATRRQWHHGAHDTHLGVASRHLPALLADGRMMWPYARPWLA